MNNCHGTSPAPYLIPCKGKVQQCTYLSRYVARVSSSSEKGLSIWNCDEIGSKNHWTV